MAELSPIMEKVSRAIEAEAGLSKSKLRGVVGGKSAVSDKALIALIRDGFVRVEPAPRNATHHYSVRPFRESP